MSDVIENKVAKSGLITLDLEELKPNWQLAEVDIAPWLWEGLALKEKDFRKAVDEHNWAQFSGKAVAIVCSADAIIPLWAWMLVSAKLQGFAIRTIQGSKAELQTVLWRDLIHTFNPEDYREKRVIIKGCSKEIIDASIYAELTFLLQPYVKSIMFGEPCSTVPVYKQRTVQK